MAQCRREATTSENRAESFAASESRVGPLSDLLIVDLTLARAGPVCVRHLADWGAEVIRIEPTDGREGLVGAHDGFDHQNLHRNKRSLQLDLKSDAGRDVLYRLVRKADIVIENMKPSVKFRLGADYETLRSINPRLVYGSISGFGQAGPYSGRGGVDQIAQGMGGLMSITGHPGGGPLRVGIPINDLTAGNLLAFGILAGLRGRDRTGEGCWVHTSLLEAQVFMLDFQAARWLALGEVAGQSGNDHPTFIPMGVFPTADKPINIAASAPHLWTKFCNAIGCGQWIETPAWSTREGRSRNRVDINAAIAEVTTTRSSGEWIALFEDIGIPCGPINTIDEVFADPQVRHLDMVRTTIHERLGRQHLVGSPINMSGYVDEVHRPTPSPGTDTDVILTDLGLTADDIGQLRASGVVA